MSFLEFASFVAVPDNGYLSSNMVFTHVIHTQWVYIYFLVISKTIISFHFSVSLHCIENYTTLSNALFILQLFYSTKMPSFFLVLCVTQSLLTLYSLQCLTLFSPRVTPQKTPASSPCPHLLFSLNGQSNKLVSLPRHSRSSMLIAPYPAGNRPPETAKTPEREREREREGERE